MLNKFSIFIFMFSLGSFAKNVEIINQSDYALIGLYGDIHYIYGTKKHNHPRTMQKANKILIAPGSSAVLELSDEQISTVYTYRLSSETLMNALLSLKELVVTEDGGLDFSKINFENIIKTAKDLSFTRALDVVFNDNSSLRYIDIDGANIDDNQVILVRNKENTGTIDLLAQMDKADVPDPEADVVATIASGGASSLPSDTASVSITNKSQFPVFMAYGGKTWGTGIFERARLDRKLSWFKKSTKGVIFEESTIELELNPQQSNQLLFYRISPEQMGKNASYLIKSLAGGVIQSSALNLVAPGSDLISNIIKLYTAYAAYNRIRLSLPFAPLAIEKDNFDACTNIVISDSANKLTIDAKCEDAAP